MEKFKIIPAIDLIDGKCVRLIQGDYAQKTIYNADPGSTAEQFLDAGFDLVHVVDLDGAKDGEPKNLKSIEDIASCGITIELGGGLRSESHLKSAINAGAQDLILGTKLLNIGSVIDEWVSMFPNQLIAGIDAKNGLVAVEGWEETSTVYAIDLIKQLGEKGFKRTIYTDIQRDGMLSGPNLGQLKSFAEYSPIPTIASGGVGSITDIKNIKSISMNNINGVILGKAIYDGKITLKELSKC
ncbi:MAG TPA: 1-(5-phosphoribosyl)-5-[(5-phosphoribosylamino)methylideneamino]imidazole-4-carboxamide isomerase [Candidatus Marinimicrobia bacterium]|nr:1-(5-phosphoribosyl)-5-[(5-phosphoribosylamino)methylideneamino]imidazole-4-carboxamide isomerase [Candidatus Neomarinimicrobiota bacterium]